jgi:hypothetical protein
LRWRCGIAKGCWNGRVRFITAVWLVKTLSHHRRSIGKCWSMLILRTVAGNIYSGLLVLLSRDKTGAVAIAINVSEAQLLPFFIIMTIYFYKSDQPYCYFLNS